MAYNSIRLILMTRCASLFLYLFFFYFAISVFSHSNKNDFFSISGRETSKADMNSLLHSGNIEIKILDDPLKKREILKRSESLDIFINEEGGLKDMSALKRKNSEQEFQESDILNDSIPLAVDSKGEKVLTVSNVARALEDSTDSEKNNVVPVVTDPKQNDRTSRDSSKGMCSTERKESTTIDMLFLYSHSYSNDTCRFFEQSEGVKFYPDEFYKVIQQQYPKAKVGVGYISKYDNQKENQCLISNVLSQPAEDSYIPIENMLYTCYEVPSHTFQTVYDCLRLPSFKWYDGPKSDKDGHYYRKVVVAFVDSSDLSFSDISGNFEIDEAKTNEKSEMKYIKKLRKHRPIIYILTTPKYYSYWKTLLNKTGLIGEVINLDTNLQFTMTIVEDRLVADICKSIPEFSDVEDDDDDKSTTTTESEEPTRKQKTDSTVVSYGRETSESGRRICTVPERRQKCFL